MERTIFRLILILLLLPSAISVAQELEKRDTEISYRRYWKLFQSQQDETLKQAQKKYKGDWLILSKNKEKKDFSVEKKIIKEIKESITKQNILLKKSMDSNLKIQILSNLVHYYYIIGLKSLAYSEKNPKEWKKVIEISQQIQNEFPTYRNRLISLFYSAQIYEKMNLTDSAQKIWNLLSHQKEDIYLQTIAYVAKGDYKFLNKQPYHAVDSYIKSLNNLMRVNIDKTWFFSVYRRIIWSSYRSGRFKIFFKYIEKIFTLMDDRSNTTNSLLRNEFVILLENVFFETYKPRKIISILKKENFKDVAVKVAKSLILKYSAIKDYKSIVKLSSFIENEFPITSELAEILAYKAESYSKLLKKDHYLRTLKKIIQITNKNSLWIQGLNKNLTFYKDIDSIRALTLTKIIEYYFNIAQKSQNPNYYQLVLEYSKEIIDKKLNLLNKNKIKWLLFTAKSYAFLGDQDNSNLTYKKILSSFKVDAKQRKKIQGHLIQNCKIKWKNIRTINLEKSDESNMKLEEVYLQDLATEIEAYARTYPQASQSIDYLLYLAYSFRELNDEKKSLKIFRKILNLKTNKKQRSRALRALIISSIKNDQLDKTIQLLIHILENEDWVFLSGKIKKEFQEVLVNNLVKYSNEIYSEGRKIEAAMITLKTYERLNGLPKKEFNIKEASYWLALEGQWKKSLYYANRYLQNKKNKQYRDDVLYLLARSQEELFDFLNSSKSYYKLARTYPKHSKKLKSLKKSELLALAEDDLSLSLKANLDLCSLVKSKIKNAQCCIRRLYYNKVLGLKKYLLKDFNSMFKQCSKWSANNFHQMYYGVFKANFPSLFTSNQKLIKDINKTINITKSYPKKTLSKSSNKKYINIDLAQKKKITSFLNNKLADNYFYKMNKMNFSKKNSGLSFRLEQLSSNYQKLLKYYELSYKNNTKPWTQLALLRIKHATKIFTSFITMIKNKKDFYINKSLDEKIKNYLKLTNATNDKYFKNSTHFQSIYISPLYKRSFFNFFLPEDESSVLDSFFPSFYKENFAFLEVVP